MKKRLNNKGFALVETLVCAIFVVAIFLILFENYVPLMAKFNRSEKYDDLDSKYISFYIKTFIESDTNSTVQTIHSKLNGGKKIYKFAPLVGDVDDPDIETYVDGVKQKPFELCTFLIKENKQKCQNFIDTSNIKAIYLVNYETTSLKTAIENASTVNGVNISRPLELYIKNMPSFSASSSSKSGYKRLIIEIEHEEIKDEIDGEGQKEVYYTYSSMELRPPK